MLDDLLEATGGHPADTMLVASHVYYAARDSRSSEITSALLQAGYTRALDDVRHYFDVIWSGLGRAARSAAHNLVETGQPYAGGQTPPSAVARAMRTLEDLGLAHRLGPRRWAVAEPMFADWLHAHSESAAQLSPAVSTSAKPTSSSALAVHSFARSGTAPVRSSYSVAVTPNTRNFRPVGSIPRHSSAIVPLPRCFVQR